MLLSSRPFSQCSLAQLCQALKPLLLLPKLFPIALQLQVVPLDCGPFGGSGPRLLGLLLLDLLLQRSTVRLLLLLLLQLALGLLRQAVAAHPLAADGAGAAWGFANPAGLTLLPPTTRD